MTRKAIGTTARPLAALALALALGVVASAHVAAQSAGMGLMDLEAARDSFFSQADADGDFALSSEEQLNAMGAANSQLFECWDADGDGLCSYTEYMDSAEKVFQELDANGDGSLNGSELQ